MRLFAVSGYPSTTCRSAQFANELRLALSLAAPTWKLHTCVIGDRGAVDNVDAAIVIDRHHRAGYTQAARRIAASGADLVIVHHDQEASGGPNGRFITLIRVGGRRLEHCWIGEGAAVAQSGGRCHSHGS